MTDIGSERPPSQADVAAILEQLRAEVRARRLAQGQSEPGPLERDLQRSLDEIELHRVVSAHWPLIGKTVPERTVALVNKLVRRYLRWYINPIVEQQNAYNDAVARTLRLLAEAYADLGDQIAEVRGTRREAQGASPADGGPSKTNEQPRLSESNSARSVAGDLMALVRERAAAEPAARFTDLELHAAEPQLRLRAQVAAHWPLNGTTALQRAVALVNKLVRRYLRWYINPIVEQQNAANAAIGAALLGLIRLDAERRAQVASLRAATRRQEDRGTRS
jgi:hypothetical protein